MEPQSLEFQLFDHNFSKEYHLPCNFPVKPILPSFEHRVHFFL